MVIIRRGRGQSVGGLGVEASRDKEQEEENINDGSSRCLCDQISELPEFLKLRYIQTFRAFFLYVFCVFFWFYFLLWFYFLFVHEHSNLGLLAQASTLWTKP